MFAGLGPKPKKGADNGISFKADDMSFEILTKKRGITPAAYLARAKWVSLDRLDRLPDKQLKAYLTRAHAIVAAGLSKKLQKSLGIVSRV
jgi:predicted DNA-binding protein (MmcQ/YjbR family)